MIIQTPAKINLFLRVTGTLPGGFHSIETLFVPVPEFSDKLEITTVPDGKQNISVRCDLAAVPAGKDNICAAAAQKVLNVMQISDSVEIFIEKKIPLSGGMGGGSSDAAAVILALQKKYGDLPDHGKQIALECGSDVPFFLNPVASIGKGRGEILTPAENLSIPEIKIIPMNFPTSAKWAYQNLQPETEHDPRTLNDMLSVLRDGNFSAAAKLMRNDLAPAVFRKFPILELSRRDFEEKNPGWKVQLSGSGSTLFAIRYL